VFFILSVENLKKKIHGWMACNGIAPELRENGLFGSEVQWGDTR
jgi:hypothetical protein